MTPGDEADVRISDTDRDGVIGRLREAVGDGRLNLDEFSDRAAVVYAARTHRDLAKVVRDLPAPAPPPHTLTDVRTVSRTPAVAGSDRPQHIVAVMSGAHRRGRWRPRRSIRVVTVMGGGELDFREAEFEQGVDVIDVRIFSVMGGMGIVVPEGMAVDLEGFFIFGGSENRAKATDIDPRYPRLVVRAYGSMGGVGIRNKSERDRHRDHHERDRDRHPDRRRLPEPPASPRPPKPPSLPSMPAQDVTVPASPLFVSEPAFSPDAEATPPMPRGTVTILFTDLVGSSSMADRFGDERWLGVISAHNALVREQIRRHQGNEIKTQGDGFVVVFSSARAAVNCAADIQRALRGYRAGHPDSPLEARIGVHTGEVAEHDGDVHGRNVIAASRIAGHGRGGEIWVSSLTMQLVESGRDIEFGAPVSTELKGLAGDWSLHEVVWG